MKEGEKYFYKSKRQIPSDITSDKEKFVQTLSDAQEAVRELIGSSTYQQLIPDSGFQETSIQTDEKSKDILSVRTGDFPNATTLSKFSEDVSSVFLASTPRLQKLEGFEKVIAACHISGESDYSPDKLMVKADGKNVTKVTHGGAFVSTYQDFSSLAQNTQDLFVQYGYDQAIQEGNLSFSIEKYSQSLNQMLEQFDEKQMEEVIDRKIDELQRAGFNPDMFMVHSVGNSEIFSTYDDISDLSTNSRPANFDDLKKFYKGKVKQQLANVKEIAKSAEIVSKFSNVSPEFMDGGWLQAFAESVFKDPVAFAVHYSIQIEGKDAQEWAKSNNHQVQMPDLTDAFEVADERWFAKTPVQENVSSQNKPEITPNAISNQAVPRVQNRANQTDSVRLIQHGIGIYSAKTASGAATVYPLKHFYNSQNNIPQGKKKHGPEERNAGISELIGFTAYQNLLGKPTPQTSVIKSDSTPNVLYVASEFFTKPPITLGAFYKIQSEKLVSGSEALRRLQGFEQTIAACHVLGQTTYNDTTLKVSQNTITQTDFGEALTSTSPADFSSMAAATSKQFSKFNQKNVIAEGNLPFNIKNYSAALYKMLGSYDEEKMNAVIEQKITELQQAGFNPRGLVYKDHQKRDVSIEDFDGLKKFYQEQAKQNVANMQEVAKSAAIVAKFSNASPEFMNGGWLKGFGESTFYKDPVAYAVQYNIQIEGKNALDWAHDNGYKIKTDTRRIGLGKENEPLSAIEYIKFRKENTRAGLSESEEEFVALARDADLLAKPQSYEVSSLPHTNIVNSKNKAAMESLVSLMDNFVEKSAASKVTETEVTKFYDQLLGSLKTHGYLTDQDVSKIKADQGYKTHASETADMMNAIKPLGLTGKDALYYKVANFCKAIGLPEEFSNLFMKQIDPKKLAELHKIEERLSERVQMRTIVPRYHASERILQAKRLEKVDQSTAEKLKDRREKQTAVKVER